MCYFLLALTAFLLRVWIRWPSPGLPEPPGLTSTMALSRGPCNKSPFLHDLLQDRTFLQGRTKGQQSAVVKSLDSGLRLPGLEPWYCHSVDMCTRVGPIAAVSFCRMWIIIAPTCQRAFVTNKEQSPYTARRAVPSLQQVLNKHNYYDSFLYFQGLAQRRCLVAERGTWSSLGQGRLAFLKGDLAGRRAPP